jgi:hypothetical protein
MEQDGFEEIPVFGSDGEQSTKESQLAHRKQDVLN